jgi:nitroimidazol reductase NimA-like FMN-containing flavoprotein (pyridoxamine 5'-phosphate oxidase superfamily)
MTSRSPEPSDVLPLQLSSAEIDALLDARLIANLASINPNGSVHLVAMWFRREGDALLFPTSRHTRKAKNLCRHAQATAMIDQSRAGLDLRGVQIKGSVELIDGPEARRLNRSIHERYVTAWGLAEDAVAAYLSQGDDLTVRLSIDRLSSWNLADGAAGRALSRSGNAHPLDR